MSRTLQGLPLNLGSSLFRVEPLVDGSYRVVSAAYPEMVFDIERASQESGAPLILLKWHGKLNQRFRFVKPPQLSDSVWGVSLKAEHSGKVLDVFQGPLGEGAEGFGTRVGQWDYHGGPNQRFRVFGDPIKPLHSDLVLDVAGGSHASGTPVVLWPFFGWAQSIIPD